MVKKHNMRSQLMRTEQDIISEGLNAISEPYSNPFLDKEVKIRLDERIRVIEWLFGQRRELYSGKEMNESILLHNSLKKVECK